MILVIGGLKGFIGSNTTEALVNPSRDCVVRRHENAEVPGFIQTHTGFSPKFDIRSALEDYVEWLKAGNPK